MGSCRRDHHGTRALLWSPELRPFRLPPPTRLLLKPSQQVCNGRRAMIRVMVDCALTRCSGVQLCIVDRMCRPPQALQGPNGTTYQADSGNSAGGEDWLEAVQAQVRSLHLLDPRSARQRALIFTRNRGWRCAEQAHAAPAIVMSEPAYQTSPQAMLKQALRRSGTHTPCGCAL